MARVVIDNTNNMYPGKISIADLAQYVPTVRDNKSDDLNIYQVEAAMKDAYPFEIERFEFEYATGYSAWFKDGSAIHISASAECDDPQQYGWQ